MPVAARYSALVAETVAACLRPDPAARPDILGVAAIVAPVLVGEFDRLAVTATRLVR